MKVILAALLLAHGALHGLGFATGFALAGATGSPIGPVPGALWLGAGILLVVAAVLLVAAPRHWWIPAAAGVALSQALIVATWPDARWATLANLVILVPLGLTLADLRPTSLRSRYVRDVRDQLASRPADPGMLGEADLVGLPPAVRTYIERTGAVGRPRVRSLRAVFRARIRSGPDSPWLEGPAEQVEFFCPPARFFYMRAARAGVPVDVFHRYVDTAATMEGRLAGLFPVLDGAGHEMTRSETVTLLNDMAVLAPAALVDAPIEWEVVDDRTVRATFVNVGHRVSAILRFDSRGDLVDFESRDRYRSDGRVFEHDRWATPLRQLRGYSGYRLPAGGEARWGEPDEAWTYGDFELESIDYNVAAPFGGQTAGPAADPAPRRRMVPGD
jgi:hypothetical protein